MPDVVASNLTPTTSQVMCEERHARNRHRGGVVWFTGLSRSGKSTLAYALERELFTRGLQVLVLDGDNVRQGLSANLGFSAQDRAENIRRVAEVAKLFAEAGFVAIVALISPYRADRHRACEILQGIRLYEVFLDVPLEVCEQRDQDHLYAKARAGEILEFTGISAPYERPESPDLVLRTDHVSVHEAIATVVEYLLPRLQTAFVKDA